MSEEQRKLLDILLLIKQIFESNSGPLKVEVLNYICGVITYAHAECEKMIISINKLEATSTNKL